MDLRKKKKQIEWQGRRGSSARSVDRKEGSHQEGGQIGRTLTSRAATERWLGGT